MPRTFKIDHEQIFTIAAAIAAEEGLEGVTMHGVARQLDVTPMALYRHVANKAELLSGLVDLVCDAIDLPESSLPWRARLRILTEAVSDAAREFPGVDAMFAIHARRSLRWAPIRSSVLAILRSGGLSPNTALTVEMTVTSAILGFVAHEASGHYLLPPGDQREVDLDNTQRMIELFVEDAIRDPSGLRTGSTA